MPLIWILFNPNSNWIPLVFNPINCVPKKPKLCNLCCKISACIGVAYCIGSGDIDDHIGFFNHRRHTLAHQIQTWPVAPIQFVLIMIQWVCICCFKYSLLSLTCPTSNMIRGLTKIGNNKLWKHTHDYLNLASVHPRCMHISGFVRQAQHNTRVSHNLKQSSSSVQRTRLRSPREDATHSIPMSSKHWSRYNNKIRTALLGKWLGTPPRLWAYFSKLEIRASPK